MTARLSEHQLAHWLGEDLSPLALLVCAALLYFCDRAFLGTNGAFLPGGPLDEAAHFLTALLLLQVVPSRLRRKVVVPALIGSVVIDLDHVPYYLGHHFLMVGSLGGQRPATHSLLTPLVLLVLALAVRRHRTFLLGLTLGVMLHFFRDPAEGSGTGLPLLWPFSTHAFTYPQSVYLAVMAGVTAACLCVGIVNQRKRVVAQ